MRNGISIPLLTTTVASQRPFTDWAAAGAGMPASARSAAANTTDSFVLIENLLKRKKAREACASRACLRLDWFVLRSRLRGHRRDEPSAAVQAGEDSGRTTRATATADHVHACTIMGANVALVNGLASLARLGLP